MAGSFGTMLRVSLFGESHGRAVGVVVDGLPAGEAINLEKVAAEMARRAPGRDPLATSRREPDAVEVLSGLYRGKTSGSPICGIIRNSDARPGDCDTALRPGHADLTALLKYGGHADLRGGGHFSGRLTAPLVFAGALAKQVLERRGVEVFGRVAEIAGIADRSAAGPEEYRAAAGAPFPVVDPEIGGQMRDAIAAAKAEKDSVGGVAEAVAFGVPPGLGEPFFRSVESELARLLFSIPAVKGVEFGDGFALSRLWGSEANDPLLPGDTAPVTGTNRCGGILGGITTGRPVVARAAFKPTPTIGKEQDTVDPRSGEAVRLAAGGRHDPCVVPRAVPAVEASVALCVLDLWMENRGRSL